MVAHCKVQGLSAVSCAEAAEPIGLLFGLWTRVGRMKNKFNRTHKVAPMCTISIYSPGGATVPTWQGTLAPPGEYNWTIRLQWRCSLMSNYFDHLSLLSVKCNVLTLKTYIKITKCFEQWSKDCTQRPETACTNSQDITMSFTISSSAPITSNISEYSQQDFNCIIARKLEEIILAYRDYMVEDSRGWSQVLWSHTDWSSEHHS